MPIIEGGLFKALEEELKAANAPLTCHDLWDKPKIRKLAESPNRVSDYLGGLWRKGLALRTPAPRSDNSSARWAYQWKPQSETKRTAQVFEYTPPMSQRSKTAILSRPNIEITDDGGVITIDLPQLTITIRAKS